MAYRKYFLKIPSIWRTANVCPIFKKGTKFEAINYRPISCKLLEHVITSHIMSHADRLNIACPHNGFRKGLSCDTRLIEFPDDISKVGRLTVLSWISSVFDKVTLWLLVRKLQHFPHKRELKHLDEELPC
jgi:hypothetical protein